MMFLETNSGNSKEFSYPSSNTSGVDSDLGFGIRKVPRFSYTLDLDPEYYPDPDP